LVAQEQGKSPHPERLQAFKLHVAALQLPRLPPGPQRRVHPQTQGQHHPCAQASSWPHHGGDAAKSIAGGITCAYTPARAHGLYTARARARG